MKTILGWLGRLVLAGAFLYAGASKALDPQAFATDIDHYRLLPHPVVLAVSVYLPWLEIFCGLAVLARRRERGALFVLGGLCVLFCAALASAWFRGLDISCGCFGHATTASVPVAFARSFILGLVAVALLGVSRIPPAPAVETPSAP